jgi:hypothetical protein
MDMDLSEAPDSSKRRRDEHKRRRVEAAIERLIRVYGLPPRMGQTLRLEAHPKTGAARHAIRRITSKDTVFEGRDLLVPTRLKPEDLDWQGSRLLEPWMVPHGTSVFHGPWNLHPAHVCYE